MVVDDVHFEYRARGQDPVPALRGVSLTVRDGERVAVVGANGSGKSTLARLLNGLLLPTGGQVRVGGLDTRDPAGRREIRQAVGMVFQNPDNQLVATIVEEDVAFGPENLGLPSDEIRARVDAALALLGLEELRHRPPHLLSGGQKQRVAIAGALAMRPHVLVLDEETALLDPVGRAEVRAAVARLHAEGTAIVQVTHFMEEAVAADRVLVMAGGRVVLEGPPRVVFARQAELRALRLDVPQVALDVDEVAAAILARADPAGRARG
ncbi:MAG: energy-coupling factor transporter ATPase [Chloroflexota bacterium]|nr:energy-coupling factor transporter ATPase [Chloroflexota bacterium]